MNNNVSDLLGAPLSQGLTKLSLTISAQQHQQLLAYLRLLEKWNQAYNLTAIRDPQEMLVKHLFDALAVQAYLPSSGHWIDVGSGGGIPGLVLAIVDVNRRWTLLDSNGKKTRFLTQAVLELGLTERVQVVHSRAEQHQQQYDGVISRAVTEVADFIAFTRHLRADNASWWLMKGVYPQAELAALSADIQVETQALSVPDLDAERWLIRCYPH